MKIKILFVKQNYNIRVIKVKVTNDQFIINGKIYMLQGNQYYFIKTLTGTKRMLIYVENQTLPIKNFELSTTKNLDVEILNKLILSRVLPNMFSVNENKDMVFMIGMIAIAFAGFILGHFI